MLLSNRTHKHYGKEEEEEEETTHRAVCTLIIKAQVGSFLSTAVEGEG